MKKQLYTLLRFKFNAAFIFLTALTLFVSCNKNDSPVTPPPPAAATISSVTGPTGLTSGPKNTIITISGTNFITDLSKIQVKVNGKICTVLTATATSITAQIPPACGTGIVELFLNGTRYAGPVFNFINTYTLTSITNGIVGYADGPLATAKFEEVMGISMDGSDNLYIAQYLKPRIRKISAAGIASNLAGDGIFGGYMDGQGLNAKFNAIDNCSSDPAGNVFVADEAAGPNINNRIRKIDVNGNTTTLADIPFFIMGIKVGRLGNIYVSGTDDVAKYSPTGVLLWRLKSHGAGNVDGDTSIARFKLFGNIEVDSAEKNIYLTSTDLNVVNRPSQIKKIDIINKTFTTVAGDGTAGDISDGNALSCKFIINTCLVLDKTGGLYFGNFNNKICYLKNGIVSTIINGTQGASLDIDGDVSIARIKTPYGLALDSQGNLFISCTGNNKIKKLTID